jgi:hypothetical protein
MQSYEVPTPILNSLFHLLAENKSVADRRLINAVNVEGSYGRWDYVVARKRGDIPLQIASALNDDIGKGKGV